MSLIFLTAFRRYLHFSQKRLFVVLLGFSLFTPIGYADDTVIVYSDEKLWQSVTDTYHLTEKTIEAQLPFQQVGQILGQRCQVDFQVPNASADLLKEAEFWEQNYGVELRGGITSGDLDSSDIDEGGNTYVELSWDVLENGYKEFDYRAKDFKRRAILERLSTELQRVANRFQCRGYQIGQSFVGIEAHIASAKLAMMESVYQIEKEAYFNGGSDLDELLISEESLIKLRRKLADLNNSANLSYQELNLINPPAFDINIETIIKAIVDDPRFKNLTQLEQQRATSMNPYRDGNRLRFFVRKEFDVLSSNRDDLVAGVRFSVPLVFSERPNYQNKVQQLEREQSLDEWERINRVRQAYTTYRDMSERVITQQYRYLRSKERMRRLFSRKTLGDPLVMSAVVARLVNYVDASLELIAVKRSMYQRANSLFLATRLEFSPEYISPLPTSISRYRARPFSRGVYIWSSTFNRVENEQLLLVLQTQSFSKAVVSYSKKTDKLKLAEFNKLATDKGIEIEWMLSNNQWVYDDRHMLAAQSVARLTLNNNTIHLDIEPQALATYGADREAYQQRFITMVSKIREQSEDAKLVLSVPFHWDESTYAAIAKLADKLVIMNYENDNPDTLVRRMKKILAVVPLENVAMAVRPKDFDSPYVLEETLNIVNKATGVDDFVMHKLSDLIN